MSAFIWKMLLNLLFTQQYSRKFELKGPEIFYFIMPNKVVIKYMNTLLFKFDYHVIV